MESRHDMCIKSPDGEYFAEIDAAAPIIPPDEGEVIEIWLRDEKLPLKVLEVNRLYWDNRYGDTHQKRSGSHVEVIAERVEE